MSNDELRIGSAFAMSEAQFSSQDWLGVGGVRIPLLFLKLIVDEHSLFRDFCWFLPHRNIIVIVIKGCFDRGALCYRYLVALCPPAAYWLVPVLVLSHAALMLSYATLCYPMLPYAGGCEFGRVVQLIKTS